MSIINTIFTWVMKKRIHDIDLFMKYPVEVQEELLRDLLTKAKDTHFGKEFDFKSIANSREYKERVPIFTYEKLYPYIDKLLKGEQKVLWPHSIKWFAKSSGTTNDRSKFIPVSQEALEDCHFKGGKDLLSMYVNNYPDTKMFSGKGLTIGGSQQVNQFDTISTSYYGDVSAVIMKNLPFWAQMIRTPKLEIALMSEWESKIEKMARVTIEENVTNFAGVPTWTIVLINKVLEITGKKNIREVWPDLEVFFHGAVAFEPYEKLFKNLIPFDDMHYVETYNASEGFFGIQDQKDSRDLLLMLDYGIYYEFIPVEEVEMEHPISYGLDEVEMGRNYAMVISTNAGLWRYLIGDTVRFTNLDPFRIRISGRTKHFINAFGEEVIVENADAAIKAACEATGAVIENFTAAPKYISEGSKGCHEWIIEFVKSPKNKEEFVQILDAKLKEVNSDYDAKRYKDMALEMPKAHFVTEGTFYNWMKKRGKLGGQNKVPRLSNDRKYVDDILEMVKTE